MAAPVRRGVVMSARRLCDSRFLDANRLGKRSRTAQHEHQQGRY
jgi:hypothetical protein